MTDIRLISEITVTPVQQMGGDHMVAAAAWVSTTGEAALEQVDANPAKFKGLIRSLMRQKHGSPFEHGALTFFVHAPIFVFREWHRHRMMSYNEESGRYKQLEPVFWVPRRERALYQRPDHKPMRPEYDPLPDSDEGEALYELLLTHSRVVGQVTYAAYEREIEGGIAKEVARRHLPLSIYSSCWVTCNPRALMHFLALRTHEPEATFVSYPQAEIEEAARVVEEIFMLGWPLTYAAWNEYGRVAP